MSCTSVYMSIAQRRCHGDFFVKCIATEVFSFRSGSTGGLRFMCWRPCNWSLQAEMACPTAQTRSVFVELSALDSIEKESSSPGVINVLCTLEQPALPNLANIEHSFLRYAASRKSFLEQLRRLEHIFLCQHPGSPLANFGVSISKYR